MSIDLEVLGEQMTKEGLHPTRECFGLTGLVNSQHQNLKALFGRYLISPPPARPAIVMSFWFVSDLIWP